MIGFTALAVLFNAVRHSRVPRPVNIVLAIGALALALYGVQPFLRTWYKCQNDRGENELLYQKLCVNRSGCRERSTDQCIQLELDLAQWPITLAFSECMGHLIDAALTLRGMFTLGIVGLFLLGLSTVLVGGSVLQRRTLQRYHLKRDADMHALATGAKQERVQ
jgi:hypothetical protein